MENLEVKIIKNLNKLLKPYKLIIKPIYFNESTYFNSTINLCNWGVFNQNPACLHFWNTIYDMLFSHDCIFNVCNKISFCKGDSLEEIMIKIDLMGI
jgi:hypothetical protein